MPELKRVILSYKNQVVMENTLQEALEALFVGKAPKPEEPKEEEEPTENLKELIKKAVGEYDKAQKHREEGNWSGFGSELENLKNTLSKLESLTENRTFEENE